MKKKITIIFAIIAVLGISLGVVATGKAMYGSGLGNNTISSSVSSVIPTFSIVSVKQDQSVTIKTLNFPKDDSFVVTMGVMGTRGIGGIKVATTDSGDGGSFKKTYTIPAYLHGASQIAIRMESPTSGYYAYNWFYNNTTDGKPSPTKSPAYSGIPTFNILAVKQDETVTIRTNNFPPNDTFKVQMNWMGTQGMGGTVVETIDSKSGGVFTMTFDIPKKYQGENRIAIRLESPSTGYYAYNWFYNNTTTDKPGTPSMPSPGYVGYPTFSITGVKQGDFMTVKINNLPPNDTFTVRMNWMGTCGINGEVVATFDSGTGGKVVKKFNIPSFLKNADRIAIRLESAESGYYAYNWFYNNDAH